MKDDTIFFGFLDHIQSCPCDSHFNIKTGPQGFSFTVTWALENPPRMAIFPFVTGFHWTWKELQADSDLIEDEG